jgi:hypothetical protein
MHGMNLPKSGGNSAIKVEEVNSSDFGNQGFPGSFVGGRTTHP